MFLNTLSEGPQNMPCRARSGANIGSKIGVDCH